MNRNHDATRNPRYALAALPESRPKRARRRSAWGAWLALAALAIGLVAAAPGRAAEEEAGLSASPNPSTNGSYTVSWTAKPGASSYQLYEGATESYSGSSLSKAYSGKAVGTYTYTLNYCIHAGFPVGSTICNIPSLYDALTVTVSDPPEPTGTISASPSPCSIPAGQRRCTTTVTWSTSNATKPCIFLSTETKFACGASGTKDAPWVTSAGRMFLLKNGQTFSADTLASVTVSGNLLPPAAPTLTAPATNSDGAYTVSWSSPTGATRYQLQQKIGTGNWTANYSGADSSKAYTGKGNGTYSYRAKACIGTAPCSGWSTTASVRVLRTPGTPGAISGPANDTDGSYEVSWGAASGTVATYELQEKTGTGTWTTVQNTSARSKSISKTTNATYHYQVRACNALSCSDWTAAKSVRVLRTPGVPGAISGPANDTDGSYEVSWGAASGTVATYELQEKTGTGTWSTVQNTSARSKDFSKSTGNTYSYQVRACNRLSCGAFTSVKTVQVTLSSPPVATDDAATTTRNAAVTIDVLANDSASGGAALTVQSATDPQGGSVTVNEGATVTYTPNAGRVGSDTFDYTITDGTATASATVTVTVENRPPVAGADSASTTANTAVTVEVLANDADPDGDALSVSSATDPANGSVTVNTDGTIAYTPDAAYAGSDSFTYTISDGIDTATGTVTIAIGGLTVETPPAPYDAPASLVTATEQSDIDQTGTMPGAFRVTESGAASYAIPIYAVPGTAGVTPELALTYNSQAGNGVAGLGWTIDGVSAIVRCRATLHQDAAAKPIQWNGQDKFCLDGQRLVLDSGTYGAPNATYRTEIDSYARIKALGGTAGHPDYFEVSGKDGSKRYYGNVPGGSHTDAKQRNGSSQTLKWALKRFEDNIGNPIWYVYSNDADGHRLTGVRYAYGTQRSIRDHHARIEFVYEDREDDATGYVAGHAFSSRKRLGKVRTHNHNGTALTLLREIRLSYRAVSNSLDKTSRLTEVRECTGSAATAPCLPATTFAWDTATPGFKATHSGQTDLTPRDDRGILTYEPADVNGDGNLDLVWLEWDADGTNDTDHHLRYALSDGTKLTAATFAGGGASIELYENVGQAQTVKMRTIDYNGDGRSDVILWRSRDPVWKVYLSTPQSTGDWKLTTTPLSTPIATSTASFSDLNGDGLVDAVYTRGLTVRARYLERDSTQTDASSRRYKFGAETVLLTVEQHMEGTIPVPLASNSVRAANHEFNGDGRADLIISAHFKDDVGEGGDLFDHTDQGPYVADADGNWTRIANFGEAELHPADLNLDGLTDLIRLVGSRVHVEINTGSGFVSSPTGITLDRNDVTVIEPMDYNGDGRPDFIWHDRDARQIKAYLWNPNTNAFDTATARTVRSTDGNKKRAHLFFDANGDGHNDYLYLTKLSTKGRLSTYLANNDGKTPRQVTAITNGLAAVTEIDYETLSRTDHYERLGLGGSATTAQFCYTFMGASGCHPYTRTTVNQANINAFYTDLNGGWNLPSGAQTLGKAGPVLEFTGPVPLVTRVDSSAPKAGSAPGTVDANATSAIEYFYAEAKVQAMGRGLLGFQQLKTKDMQTKVETTTTYRQDFPFTGLPVSTKVELPVTEDVPAEGDLPATTRVVRRLLSESATTWKLKGYLAAWARTAETSGTAAVDAFQPYAAQVVEKTYDLNDGTNTAPTLLATVTTDSEYDGHGNATSVTVTTAGGGTFRTRTANTYGPTEADRRNGRLTSTVVTTARDLNGDGALGASEQVTRRSDFNYYGQTPGACPVTSAAHAGMLCQEIVEPAHERLKVTTTHRYDAFGNRTRSKVDYFDDTPAPGGAAVTGTARIKTRCGAAAAATAYDARGRFVQTTADCLGRRLTEVTGRNAHGSPTGVKRYLNAARTSFVADAFAHTARGVEYLRKSGTGAHALTTRKQGGHAQCPANEAAGAMGRKAKVRTAFHERVRTGGGGESVRCYDKLAREVRTAAKGFDGTWIHRDVEHDALGRVRRASEPHYAGQANCQAGGGGQSRCWTATEHDILSRVTRIELPDGSAARTSYARYVATHTNALSQTRTEERNALGELVKTTDHEGGVVRFTHDVQGNVTAVAREKPTADTTAAPASVTTAMAYDLLGRMTGMADPDKGASSHRRNALGELTCRQGAAGHFTVMAYDGLGRMASRKDYRAHAGAGCSMLTGAQAASLEADAAWTHDSAANGLGLLAEATDSKSGYRKVHAYDAHGRPDTAATTPGTGNGTHYEKTTYDQHGRVFQAFDASRTSSAYTDNGVRHAYNANGHLQALRDAVGVEDAQGSFTPRTTYRTVTAVDARGNVTAERLGNGVARSRAFDGRTGRLRTLRAGLATAADRQDRTYDWDVLGNLTRRQWTLDGTARSEAFTYDGLNRLETHQVAGGALNSITYDGYGNIRSRTGAGTYAYGADASPAAAGPHAATSVTRPGTDGATVTYAYDANGNNTSSTDGRTVAYTAFDKPRTIAKGNHATTFAYGPDRSRFKRTDTTTVGTGADAVTRTTTTLYLGGVERITRPDGTVQTRRRIGGVAIETANSNGGCAAGGGALRYVLRDHLGSVDALLDGAGAAVQGMAFGPWGQRRQPGTGNGLTEAQRTGFDACRTTRGFTGHEMVDALGVVHMNGRIYDPALARFLQADPFVQFPADLQSWNRYSYVLNNPLAYTDPSGHFVFSLAALVAVSAQQGITWYAAAAIVGAAGFGDALAQGASFGQALRSGLFSGLSAAAFTGIGAGLGTEFSGTFAAGLNAPGFGLKVALHGTVGGITSILQGGRFGHGFAASGFTALGSGLNNSRFIGGLGFSPLRVAIGAAIGGTASRITGGKFANGAVTGAFSQALNNESSEVNAKHLADALQHLNPSEAFREAYATALKNGVRIQFTRDDVSHFDAETNTVYWNPLEASDIDAGISSAASALAHEISHAVRYHEVGGRLFNAELVPPASFETRIGENGIPDIIVGYGVSVEEKRATEFERTVQSQIGEPVRRHYGDGRAYPTTSPTFYCFSGDQGCQ